MERLPTGEPVWDLVFDEKGRLTAPASVAFLGEVAAEGVADLFVFSHGWGTSEAAARGLYDAMFPLIRDAASGVAGIGRVGFAGIYWPSLWFPDTPATPPRPAGSTQAGDGAVEDESAGTAVLSGAEIAESLLPGFEDPAQRETLVEIGRLIDEGEAAVGSGEPDTVKEERLQHLNQLLQSLVPPAPDGQFEDSGETALLRTDDPKQDYQAVAEAFGSAPPGSSAQGIGDWFAKAIHGAKDVVRVFSYTVMKTRAGDIGRAGLGPLLVELHRRAPAVRVHLIGHSFGARLVSFALSGIATRADSPVASLVLVQGAFSHWSFAHAQDNPFRRPGALHTFADRVHGPLVATFSVHDWAVGRWYPKASFLARQDAEATTAGRWDGMGADGYQAVAPAADRSMPAGGGTDYQFTSGTFYRVDAASVINNVNDSSFAGAHSDIRKPAVAQLAVAAAAHSELPLPTPPVSTPVNEPEGQSRSPIIGDLDLPPERTAGDAGSGSVNPDEKVPALIELNVTYPGGLVAVRTEFYSLWDRGFAERAGGSWPEQPPPGVDQPTVPDGLQYITPKLYQCVLSRRDLRDMVEQDQQSARSTGLPPVIFRVWPDYQLEPQIDRSAPTVKADAAWRSYDARGHGIVWAVIDSGIDASHPHFSELELAKEGRGEDLPQGRTSRLHRDFSYLVNPDNPLNPAAAGEQAGPAAVGTPPSALVDESGHGTHVAGIIAGCTPDNGTPRVAVTKDPQDGGYVPRARVGKLSGMAPACELVSLKVMRLSSQGQWVTSFSAVIRALTYLRTEVNVDPAVLRVHGVNMSLGCEWHPEHYAAGQSPLCQALNQLVATGVVVVVSAGNYGARTTRGESVNTSAVLGSITEPAHAEDCIAVGSTHRDAPHAFGVTWTSSKGPTLDGRMKPDVVAPGEWIASAATGEVRAEAGLDRPDGDTGGADEATGPDPLLTYAEQSGTSMAAPHVSGVIAAFLSARPEFIGRPRQVKRLLTQSATDLGRERYAQGAGLVDLMRMLANV